MTAGMGRITRVMIPRVAVLRSPRSGVAACRNHKLILPALQGKAQGSLLLLLKSRIEEGASEADVEVQSLSFLLPCCAGAAVGGLCV